MGNRRIRRLVYHAGHQRGDERGERGVVSGLRSVLTTFVQRSPIAQFIKDNSRAATWTTRRRGSPGRPWGYRHQFNIADSGTGRAGPPRVE